jgi:hypothetical protein
MEHRLAGLLQLKSYIYNLKGGKYTGMTGHALMFQGNVNATQDVIRSLPRPLTDAVRNITVFMAKSSTQRQQLATLRRFEVDVDRLTELINFYIANHRSYAQAGVTLNADEMLRLQERLIPAANTLANAPLLQRRVTADDNPDDDADDSLVDPASHPTVPTDPTTTASTTTAPAPAPIATTPTTTIDPDPVSTTTGPVATSHSVPASIADPTVIVATTATPSTISGAPDPSSTSPTTAAPALDPAVSSIIDEYLSVGPDFNVPQELLVNFLDDQDEAAISAERSGYTGATESGPELTADEQTRVTVDAAEMQGGTEDQRSRQGAAILEHLTEANSDANPDRRSSQHHLYLLRYGSMAPSHLPHVMAQVFPDLFPYG